MRILLPLSLLAAPAGAAERSVGIGSFERLRVEGPIEVRVTAGTSPSVRISGDRDAVEAIEVRLDGGTLAIRPGAGVWGERPPGGGGDAPLVVAIGTPLLRSLASIAGARIAATAARGDRIDLSVAGAGAVSLGEATGGDLVATVIGAGTIAVAGRTARARLVANGPGTIDAAALDAGEVTVRLDGTGAIRARARYIAQGSNTGLGEITVAGSPRCLIRTAGSGRTNCAAR